MTRKRKTEARKKRKLKDLNAVQNDDRKALSEKQGGSLNPIEIGRASNSFVANKSDGTVSK